MKKPTAVEQAAVDAKQAQRQELRKRNGQATDSDDAAFPFVAGNLTLQSGISARAFIAAAALQGVLARRSTTPENAAVEALEAADALLAELAK